MAILAAELKQTGCLGFYQPYKKPPEGKDKEPQPLVIILLAS